MPLYEDPVDGRLVDAADLETWTAELIERLGTPPDVAADVATVLVAADRRGIASHGTARLPQYVKLVDADIVDPRGRPQLEAGGPVIQLIDGRNGWGHHTGRIAMDSVIERAREFGLAASVVRNGNHFGIAGWYAMRAAEQGLIGLCLTNSSPLVAPTRARVGMLGTNPIAFAAPAGRYGMVVLDMATSAVPRGRIEVASRRGETLPRGWAIGPTGEPALTPDAALDGALQPLGGEEHTAGYKGYGLALMVELLTGVLAGAKSGPDIARLFSTERPSDLGQYYCALDPDSLTPSGTYAGRLERLIEQLTTAPTAPDAPGPVLFPGQPEAERAALSERRGAVLDVAHEEALLTLAQRYSISFPSTRPIPAA